TSRSSQSSASLGSRCNAINRRSSRGSIASSAGPTPSSDASPTRLRSIFSGEKDVVLSTERKKLTIFFSDVVNFTATTEDLQPEELTALLNEYLTEMSQVAIKHGGSVNKFIGDAMLVFFGDPTTQGAQED